ncbi:MAG: HDIG domain-containing protein [Anaerolineales bacterium]|nr:HDIG domain-containing protein [Anaerolineales bacterium]
MNREQAYDLVNEFVKNRNLVNHMVAVEAAMRFYARRIEPDQEEKWAVVGLLHDFDWEVHPTAEEHPSKGALILRERGVSEEIIRAVLSHAPYSEVSRDSQMEKALFACDELTGLITAVSLVRPSKSIMDLSVKSVKNKWKDKGFAAGANREEMELGAQEFGVELWDHVGNVIQAMQDVAEELGLAGQF